MDTSEVIHVKMGRDGGSRRFREKRSGREEAGGAEAQFREAQLIDTARDKVFARRRADGTFKEMDDVGRSLSTSPAHCEAHDQERLR